MGKRFNDYTIEIEYEDDGSVLASVAELEGCHAAGDDANDALEMLQDSFDLWVEDAVAAGREMPEPLAQRAYSGRFLLRMPTSLHADAARSAQRDNVSLNQLILTSIARALGQSDVVDLVRDEVDRVMAGVHGAEEIVYSAAMRALGEAGPPPKVLEYLAKERVDPVSAEAVSSWGCVYGTGLPGYASPACGAKRGEVNYA